MCTWKCSLQPHNTVQRAVTWPRSSKTLFSFFPQEAILNHLHFVSFQPPGRQEAIAVCLHIQTQQTVNDTLCDTVHRPPAMSQACNTEPCPPRYVLSRSPGHTLWMLTPSSMEEHACALRLAGVTQSGSAWPASGLPRLCSCHAPARFVLGGTHTAM